MGKTSERTATEALEGELKTVTEAIARHKRTAAQKSEQLRRTIQSGDHLRRKLLQDIAEAKIANARQTAAMEQSMQSVRSNTSLLLEETRLSVISVGSQSRAECLQRETE